MWEIVGVGGQRRPETKQMKNRCCNWCQRWYRLINGEGILRAEVCLVDGYLIPDIQVYRPGPQVIYRNAHADHFPLLHSMLFNSFLLRINQCYRKKKGS